MKQIQINLNTVKNLANKFIKNLSLLFFAVFLFLIVLEVFEIQISWQIISNADQQPVVTGGEKGVRINFENYNKVVDRIEHSDSFQPTGGITVNPFSNKTSQ